jgi:hypothetical protein
MARHTRRPDEVDVTVILVPTLEQKHLPQGAVCITCIPLAR